MATTSSFSVHPRRGIGSLVLGVSVHDILIYLKAHPHLYPKIESLYSPADPVNVPFVLNLPRNGIRLRFDGPDQRLRLIEVLDFTKMRMNYKSKEIVKVQDTTLLSTATTDSPTGPSFRHVYHNLLGPTFPGEYHPPAVDVGDAKGTYILSYPGVAFTFPLSASAWSPSVDFVSLLTSSATSPAVSMAVFDGDSWPQTRGTLFTKQPTNPRSLALAQAGKNRDALPDEVEMAKVYGEGRVELIRRNGSPFWVVLSETTPQELVTELGPPDAIYRKNDRRLNIHRAHVPRTSSMDSMSGSPLGDDELTDTDHSSNQTETDYSDDDDNAETSAEARELALAECFYNYYSHGFDIFISQPTNVSPKPPASDGQERIDPDTRSPPFAHNHLTATKIIFHGNIPGSYPFNRHRRSRWTLDHVGTPFNDEPLTSEMSFDDISGRLRDVFRDIYNNRDEEQAQQRGMVLNRGWGDSPGSSCELLGGWEEQVSGKRKGAVEPENSGDHGLGNTELFGFPGMVFEVLKSGAVSALTIF